MDQTIRIKGLLLNRIMVYQSGIAKLLEVVQGVTPGNLNSQDAVVMGKGEQVGKGLLETVDKISMAEKPGGGG